MHTFKARRLVAAAAIMATGTVLLLWSWNTVAGLFGGPTAELRHLLAALVLLGTARLLVAGPRGHRRAARHDRCVGTGR